jgi:hypothetical protein
MKRRKGHVRSRRQTDAPLPLKQGSSRFDKSGLRSEKGNSTKELRRKIAHLEQTLRTREKLTSPEFLKELREKEDFYYFNLSSFNSGNGQRFDKEIVRDPVFKAVRYCRRRTWQAELRKELQAILEREFSDKEAKVWTLVWKRFLADPPPDWTEAYDPEPERLLTGEFFNAVKHGNIARLQAIVKICEIHETTAMNRPRERQCDSRRWHYYVAYAARGFLEKGLLPNKKGVEEVALVTQLGDEFPYAILPHERWADEWKRRFERLPRPSERTWSRIFRALGLSDLPSAPSHSR